MKTLEQLLASHCRDMKGSAMGEAQIAAQLRVVDQWALDANALARTYHFNNYYETLAFVNALAYVVHREDHHPELRVTYNQCGVRFNTHSVNGISENDFISAAKADAIYAKALPVTGAE
ncbi:MAG: 4a-hydroxytetrahydrobiopterin dehydratase [Burkholderiaceae bacterium]|nr:4a-hydroxytetrahydrobiopterin dehydratase [Burkholderiaceae bacterium]